MQQGKGTVVQLHRDTLKGLHRFFKRNFNELKDDRLIRTKHRTGSNPRKQRVGNLTGSTGDSNANGWFHEGDKLCSPTPRSKQKSPPLGRAQRLMKV